MTAANGAGDMPHCSSAAGHLSWKGFQDCVHCGLCLPSCPTYLVTGMEMASPRGRISMVQALDEGTAGFSGAIVKHLDQCLGCLACQAACPSGVPYGSMLEAAREQVEEHYRRPGGDRLVRWLLAHLLPYPERLGRLVPLLYWYQRLGIARAVRGSGILSLLSSRLAQMEALLPAVPSSAERRPLPPVTPAVGKLRGRVGFMTGCAQRFLLPRINRASVRVLAAAGYEVVTPEGQGCCGALHLHAGDPGEGRKLAKALIETFEQACVELIVANAAGCGAAMKEYGELLRDEPAWRARAEKFSSSVRDISQVLSEVMWNGALGSVPLTVAYHEACHLAHAQRLRREPRAILAQIPGLTLADLTESNVCCGSAGIYNLVQTGMAGRLLQRKVAHIQETGASYVAAGNIGCLLQIAAGLRQAGLATRTVHPVELVDWSLHGMPAEERF